MTTRAHALARQWSSGSATVVTLDKGGRNLQELQIGGATTTWLLFLEADARSASGNVFGKFQYALQENSRVDLSHDRNCAR